MKILARINAIVKNNDIRALLNILLAMFCLLKWILFHLILLLIYQQESILKLLSSLTLLAFNTGSSVITSDSYFLLLTIK